MGALDHRGALRAGAVRRDLVLLRRAHPQAAAILRELGTPLLIHQPSYSMLNRWIEDELLDTLGDEGVGCIAFSPLAQGMLTDALPRTGSRRTPGWPRTSRCRRTADRREPRAHPRAERHRRPARADPGAAGARLGAARPAGHLGAHRRLGVEQLEQNLAALSPMDSATRNSRRSTVTPSKGGSTSGRDRAPPDGGVPGAGFRWVSARAASG